MNNSVNHKVFLFSIDLEDIRLRMDNGASFKERVPNNVEAYLKWLQKNKAQCTFFTTGDVAALYPSLINEIAAEGHEVACHTDKHIPIDQQTPDEFKRDVLENIAALQRAGVKEIEGFRAPVFSLTEKTQWAYDILAELNFSYSSSVLPAKNPLYGWDSFGHKPKRINDKIIEIPMTVGRLGPMVLPAVGGVYFRVLPEFMISRLIKKVHKKGLPVLSYFHPYDIDTEQEKFMHPGINNSMFYNFLLNYNRKDVFKRLDRLMAGGLEICTYISYAKQLRGII